MQNPFKGQLAGHIGTNGYIEAAPRQVLAEAQLSRVESVPI